MSARLWRRTALALCAIVAALAAAAQAETATKSPPSPEPRQKQPPMSEPAPPPLDADVGTTLEPAPDPEITATDPAPPPPQAPALWRFQDADSTLYVFGSIHEVPIGTAWRRPAFDAAFEEAEVVFFETSVLPARIARAGLLITVLTHGSNGRPLSEALPEGLRTAYHAFLARHNLNAADFDRFQPWHAAFLVVGRSIQGTGVIIVPGVESAMEPLALRRNKDVRYFETLEFQLRLFADLSFEEQLILLQDAVYGVEQHRAQYDALVESWLSADLAALEQVMSIIFPARPAVMRRNLLEMRNHAWAETLDAWMAGEGVALVIVGAGHLVGPENLIALLEARGYASERR